MDYTRFRDMATRVIPKWGVDGVLHQTHLVKDPAKPWLETETTTTTPIKLVQFPDDGTTFVNHNLTGNLRILLIAPVAGMVINIGDTFTYGANKVTAQRFKSLDPDGTGPILWAVLVL